MWFFIVLALLILLIGWCMIDFHLGRREFRETRYKRVYPKRFSNIILLTHGPDLFNHLCEDIKTAKESVHVLFFILSDDHFSREFMDLLIQKAQDGVEVRLLLDQIGSTKVKKQHITMLRDGGVDIAFSQKVKAPYFFFTFQQRNHRKISTIDGKIGYLGGYNVGREYIDEDPKLSPWRDYHLRLDGEGVQDLQKEFLLDWFRATNKDLSDEAKYFPVLEKGTVTHQIFPTEGIRIEEIFSRYIEDAKTSITIGTPYFIPTEKVMNSLILALKRGVTVTIIVPNKSDHMLVKEASFPYFRKLLVHGANIYQYMEGFYHAKVMMIDNDFCDIGTANFDKRSFELNLELNNFLYDQQFIKKVKIEIAKDISGSERLTIEKLNSVSFFTRVKEAVAGSISTLL
jgi:cardiolipin synthase A/B